MNSILTFLNSLFSQSWWSGVSVLLGALLGAFASIVVSFTQGHREEKRIRHEYYVNQNDRLIADSAAFIRLCLAHNDAVRDEIEAKNRYEMKCERTKDTQIRMFALHLRNEGKKPTPRCLTYRRATRV